MCACTDFEQADMDGLYKRFMQAKTEEERKRCVTEMALAIEQARLKEQGKSHD
ncbi:hypothetical protein CAY60_010340 [Shouchella clausii]|uniref:Uncharacterized protein n=2 Tax=Shouchella TaxID=2893057 RepID=Q5WES8_SHOC1|nr:MULTISPECIES: hypothetical protein [Shouchella]MCM3313327.1 hypothetical protein [Psychrobacillus sp. MER TA 17]ALA54484.1 hypothetical protein DB29_03656 [Shouchella clausii]MBU3232407.1 hypothetical protein [Shouchella clausii]MBU3265785.1 hypothetical protein [Shouchella clausii]MBU3505907.1 hypothetical protein [Shouchella clausii]